jgi:hypothetical protein
MPAVPVTSASPLTPEHLAQMALAQQLYRPIARARRYSMFEGWTLVIFGLISWVSLFCGGLSGAAAFISLALCVTGTLEIGYSKRLKNADPDSPRLLAINQLALTLSLVIYGAWQIIALHYHPLSLAKSDPALSQLGDTSDWDSMSNNIFSLVYYALIAIAILWEGPTAYYFYSRKKPLARYLAEVPDWARTLAQQSSPR